VSTTRASDELTQASVERCANCDAVLTGEYCSACGERRLSDADLRTVPFLLQQLREFTNIDSRLTASFVALMRRPGLLTREYMAGRRRAYIAPFQLFLIINLVYFILSTIGLGSRALSTTLDSQMHSQRWSPIVRTMVASKLRDDHVDLETYRTRFNRNTTTQAQSLVLLMIPLLAGVLALVYARSGQPSLTHLVFSLHLYPFFLLLFVGLGIGVRLVAVVVGMNRLEHSTLNFDQLSGLFLSLAIAFYVFTALRRAYGDRPLTAALRSCVVLLAVIVVLNLYRMILFFTVFYTT
jgi:hypothetical protein